MLLWLKSLFTDVSAGTLLVVMSMSVVLALMFALGEIASRTAELEPTPGSFPSGSSRELSTVSLPVAAPAETMKTPHGSVSVMVPVGAMR